MAGSNDWGRDGRMHMGLGLLAIAFGVVVMLWPSVVFTSIGWVVGLFAIALGVMALWGMRGLEKDSSDRMLRMVLGIGCLAVGGLTIWNPGVLGPLMFAAAGLVAIAFGGIHIFEAVRHPRAPGAWIVGVIGAGMMLFGFVCLSSPMLGVLGARWALGGLGLLLGIGELALGRTRMAAARTPAVTFLPEAAEEPVKH